MIKRLMIILILLMGISPIVFAQQYLWRYRTHANDCPSLTDGKVTDLCYEQDDQTLYKCVPTTGDCDTAAEWKLDKSGVASSGWVDGGTNVYNSTTTDTVGIGTTNASGSLEIVKQGSTAPLMVSATATGDGNYLLVNSSGNVGIGTTLPISALDMGTGVITSSSIDTGNVFNVKKYGALGDGIQVVDGAITSGDATFTSATASFTSADVGKVITIQNAGGTNIDLTSTISSINSATSIEIATNASATVSSSYATYGTDDCTAIRSTITAIGSDSTNGKSATMFFPAGTYIVNCAFDQSGNSQIGFPPNVFSSAVTSIKLLGATIQAENGAANNGSIIYGTKYGASGSDDIMSVTDATSGANGNIARVNITLENIRIRTVQDPTHTAVNLIDADTAQGSNVIFDTSSTYNSPVLPTHSDSYALKMPGVLAGNVTGGWRGLKIKTFYNGVLLGEHSFIFDAFIVQGVNALHFFDCRYEATVIKASVESVQNAVLVTSGSSTTSYFRIINLDIEHQTGTFANVTDVIDSSNLGVGDIRYSVFVVGGASATFTTSGAKYISRHNLETNQYEYRPVSGDFFRIVNPNTDSSSTGGALYLMQNDASVTDIGTRIGFLAFAGLGNTTGEGTYNYGAVIQAIAAEAFSSTNGGTHLVFRTAPTGSVSSTERVRITSQGNIGIGTTTPTALFQAGTSSSTAFQISTTGGITSAGNVGISTVAPTSCLCKTYTNGLCTTLASCT